MNNQLLSYSKRPEIETQSSSKFWDDEHISKGMLEAHLNPDWDAATRKPQFVTDSVNWISTIAPPTQFPTLLDLGCGPGLYAEKLHQSGFRVTGLDFSNRSLVYAQSHALENDLPITYKYQNYLEFSDQEAFDVITLIYCDFAVLSDDQRKILLRNIYKALKPNGKFILDVFTPKVYEDREESKVWSNHEEGFWSAKPHMCLDSFYRYEESHTMLEQTIVITEHTVECYNIWDHTFTTEELGNDLGEAGFSSINFFGDVAGAEYHSESHIICAVASKGRKD